MERRDKGQDLRGVLWCAQRGDGQSKDVARQLDRRVGYASMLKSDTRAVTHWPSYDSRSQG
jgi:hypothetical protein